MCDAFQKLSTQTSCQERGLMVEVQRGGVPAMTLLGGGKPDFPLETRLGLRGKQKLERAAQAVADVFKMCFLGGGNRGLPKQRWW